MQGIRTRAAIGNAAAAPQQSTVSAEASKMLEAALQQMDGIISGSGVGGGGGGGGGSGSGSGGVGTQSSGTAAASNGGSGNCLRQPAQATPALSERSAISATNVLSTAKTLALALQQVGLAAPAPDPVTAAVIGDWLETHIPRQDADERLRRLQRDKEALALQYQLLSDRVAEQADRLVELEGVLTERTQQLSAKEEQLQRQMLSRSTLETQKLELMSALSELKLHRAALERENVELKGVEARLESGALANAHFHAMKRLPYGSMGNLHDVTSSSSGGNGGGSGGGGGPRGLTAAPKTPPASLRHQIHPQFHSLPRSHATKQQKSNSNNNNNNNNSSVNNNNNNRSFDAHTKQMRNVAFASNEKILIDDIPPSSLGSGNGSGGYGGGGGGADGSMYGSFISQHNSTPSPSPNLRERSAKSFRNIFGKLRRSNSGNLELPAALEQAEPEFKRGGVGRATAGGRIEWTSQAPTGAGSRAKAYADWTPQEVCNWLCDLGLACYEDECRKWLKANPSVCLFSAAPQDIEKELNIKMPLHRKKIQLASDELTGREEDPLALKAAQLDVSWVLRWLDDIGLPQYKDTFLLAKMDGRMLHRLTMEDLAQLHVTSCLHIASLRRAIQCMRETDWHPECLIRRSTRPTTVPERVRERERERDRERDDSEEHDADADANGDENDPEAESEREPVECHESIALWTAHRVMEWLRVADLSEYAPNLRGAGVHGALMLYEARFNADLLADLLSIPPSKTLLRRHLATHFKELLGRDVIHAKRDAEALPGHQPLTITAKIKAPKKAQFSLKRRKSTKGPGEIEWTDYVCPMSMSMCLGGGGGGSGDHTHNSSTTSSSSTNNSNSLQSN